MLMTFRRWLKQQETRDDPTGDLARDIRRDDGLVRTNQSLNELYGWLHIMGASRNAKQALIDAYREWQQQGNTYRTTRDRARQAMSPRLRFKVFKRDEYRCQICGRTAQHGIVLEVDHKVPVARGGSDEINNLWTLCFDCNRGKRDDSL